MSIKVKYIPSNIKLTGIYGNFNIPPEEQGVMDCE